MTRLEAYEDLGGKWRWRLLAGNGRIIASSGESFDSHANALRAAMTMKCAAGAAVISSVPGIATKAVLRFRALLASQTPLPAKASGNHRSPALHSLQPRRARVRPLRRRTSAGQ